MKDLTGVCEPDDASSRNEAASINNETWLHLLHQLNRETPPAAESVVKPRPPPPPDCRITLMNGSKEYFVTANCRVPKPNPLYGTTASWSLNVGLFGIEEKKQYFLHLFILHDGLQAFQGGKRKQDNRKYPLTERKSSAFHLRQQNEAVKLFGDRRLQSGLTGGRVKSFLWHTAELCAAVANQTEPRWGRSKQVTNKHATNQKIATVNKETTQM